MKNVEKDALRRLTKKGVSTRTLMALGFKLPTIMKYRKIFSPTTEDVK